MTKRILSVIDTAYRACQEEQDDAGLWFSAAVHAAGQASGQTSGPGEGEARGEAGPDAGLELTVLLTGNAVGYACSGHATSPLSVGGGAVAHPFDPGPDLQRLASRGVGLFVLREDVELRGIEAEELLPCVELVGRDGIADLCEAHDAIWRW